MGIFSMFSKKASTSEELETHKVNLDKTIISLSKDSGFDFSELTSKVKLVLDYSGSMESKYNNGEVQTVINKLFPLALKFDDDGELDCYLFSTRSCELPSCNLDNFATYVQNIALRKTTISMGGTYYHEPLKLIHKKVQTTYPELIIFITDGDNSDKSETNEILRSMCTDNCFILFIGIGYSTFCYLQEVDNLSGRIVDNTGFVKFEDIARANDNTLYTTVLTEYHKWLKGINKS